MKSNRIPFVLLMLTAQFVFAVSQLQNCADTDVKLTEQLTVKDGAVTLLKTTQTLTLTVEKSKNCIMTINAYKMSQITMSVTKAEFNAECNAAYLKAGNTTQRNNIEACKNKLPKDPLFSSDGTIFMEVKSSNTPGTIDLSFKTTQRPECGLPEIVLEKEIETITFPMNMKSFTTNSECNVEVKRATPRPFTMRITQIDLYKGECNNDYIAASPNEITSGAMPDKKCKPTDVNYTIAAPDGKLFLQILTQHGQENAKVTLEFKTDFSECGSSAIEISENSTEITLPPKDKNFKPDTLCNIRVFDKESKNFAVTIPKIDFATGDCKEDYVSVSTNSQLPNATYLKCGSDPVNDPFVSTSGELYLQIKTKTASKDKTVNLKFERVSGASKPGPYAFVGILLLKLFIENPILNW